MKKLAGTLICLLLSASIMPAAFAEYGSIEQDIFEEAYEEFYDSAEELQLTDDEAAQFAATGYGIYFYEDSVVPEYDLTGATKAVSPLWYPSASNVSIARYFYYSDRSQVEVYESVLLYYGWIKAETKTGTDSNGNYELSSYKRVDTFDGRDMAAVSVYYYPEKEEVDVLYTIHTHKLPKLIGSYARQGSLIKNIWGGKIEYAIANKKLIGKGLKMMIAEYNDDGTLARVRQGLTLEVSNGVRLIADLPENPATLKYRIFLWDGENQPLTNAISAI